MPQHLCPNRLEPELVAATGRYLRRALNSVERDCSELPSPLPGLRFEPGQVLELSHQAGLE